MTRISRQAWGKIDDLFVQTHGRGCIDLGPLKWSTPSNRRWPRNVIVFVSWLDFPWESVGAWRLAPNSDDLKPWVDTTYQSVEV